MIHIATVHWKDDRWVDIQIRYLKEALQQPFQVYAFLNGLNQDHSEKYFYSSSEPIESHAIKLNLLADIASFNTETENDILMFLDGDAFPIGDILSLWKMKSPTSPIMAVQRRENNGDIQPHPCFCMTTVKFWRKIRGDWKAGYSWKDGDGRSITDVGGNMLKILNDRNIEWHAILRSNKRELHPLWFGIYGDIIYHHGAAFRDPASRLDIAGFSAFQRLRFNFLQKHLNLKKIIPKRFDPLYEIAKKNRVISEHVFKNIQTNRYFYQYFQGLQDNGLLKIT